MHGGRKGAGRDIHQGPEKCWLDDKRSSGNRELETPGDALQTELICLTKTTILSAPGTG